MKFSSFFLPTVGTKKQIESGMLPGGNKQAYQNTLNQITEQVKLGDEIGLYAAIFPEHHFHIEGIETANNPVLLSLYFGMKTKNIKVGQLGNVLPMHNPLRLAEDIAMVDHMLKGRLIAGFARGYAPRWTEVMGQIYGVGPSFSDASEMDKRNRELFDEHYEIMKKAWTTETFSHEGKTWTIPPKGLVNTQHFPAVFGKGQDENDNVTEIGVVPKPYQKDLEKWQAFSASPETFKFCAREGIVPFAFTTRDDILTELFDAYVQESEAVGRKVRRGENMGIFREVMVARTDEEAFEMSKKSTSFTWSNVFGAFNETFREPGETGPVTFDTQDRINRGYSFVGSPDTVNFMIEDMVKKHGPEHLLMLESKQGLIPRDDVMRHMELLATEVMPNWVD